MSQRQISLMIGGLVLSLMLAALGTRVLAQASMAQGASTIHIAPPGASVEGQESLAPAAEPVVSRTVEIEPVRMQAATSIPVTARVLRIGYLSSAMQVEPHLAARSAQPYVATEPAIRQAESTIPSVSTRSQRRDDARAAAACTVNSTADSGAGTLRRCLENAVPGSTINFSATVFPPAGPATIYLLSALPWIITNSLTIDASNAGVILNGIGLSSGDGLAIVGASGVRIQGLQIVYFPRHGVAIANGARNTTIGGSRLIGSGPSGQGNLISGNGQCGVRIQNAGTVSNTVSGNYIGTDTSGNLALPNYYDGVEIIAGAANNTIGGTTPGAHNLISGNGEAGVWIQDAGTTRNTVLGNYIGADISGTVALPNYWGVIIGRGAMNNIVGGDAHEARNLIGGNMGPGVLIQNIGTMSNVVRGNYIGTDISGAVALPNYYGVAIIGGATNNAVGGDTPGACNLISGNGHTGILLQSTGTMSNAVQGNYIGTDVSGTALLGNGLFGVVVDWGAMDNTIGGIASGARNLISGNGLVGVWIQNQGTVSNTVSGNYIGTDISGASALPNYLAGVAIITGTTNNTIGGIAPGARNLISGNGRAGVWIQDAGTMRNAVMGNYIGTNVSGTTALPNYDGVEIYGGAASNTVGGSAAGARNLISGNSRAGVWMQDAGTSSNTILGNYIGTDASGTAALPNYIGMLIGRGPTNNIIGGTVPGARNLVSGNREGVRIEGAGTMSNTVLGNYIGTNISGTWTIGNEDVGVLIWDGATNNTIGGLVHGARNLIGGNGGAGVWIQDERTRSNMILGNTIGTTIAGDASLGNEGAGVFIGSGAAHNTIGVSNTIACNALAGVTISDTTTLQNTVTRNVIRDNNGPPIYFVGWPIPLPPATLNGFSALDNTVWGESCSGCRVEIYANPTITPAGAIFLGDVTADDNGKFSLALNGMPPYLYLAATATYPEGTTSEFSKGFRLAGSRLTPGAITVTVSSSATIAYVHTLTNVGPGTDTFTLTTVSKGGWPVMHKPLQVMLGSGVTATVVATLTVPDGLAGRVVDRLVITATSALNPQAVTVAQDITIFDNWFRVYLPLVTKKQ